MHAGAANGGLTSPIILPLQPSMHSSAGRRCQSRSAGHPYFDSLQAVVILPPINNLGADAKIRLSHQTAPGKPAEPR